MKTSERGWVRGAVVIGIAGAMMAVALLSPALAGKLATRSYVKKQVKAATTSLQGQINSATTSLQGQINSATTSLQGQITSATAATQAQSFVRSASIVVPAFVAVAAEIGCPSGMVATGGGAAVSNSGLLLNDSVPTDATGTFTASFGLTGGVGFTGWGAIVTDTGGGGGTFRVYASCRTGTQTGSNYTAGATAPRAGEAGTTFTNVAR